MHGPLFEFARNEPDFAKGAASGISTLLGLAAGKRKRVSAELGVGGVRRFGIQGQGEAWLVLAREIFIVGLLNKGKAHAETAVFLAYAVHNLGSHQKLDTRIKAMQVTSDGDDRSHQQGNASQQPKTLLAHVNQAGGEYVRLLRPRLRRPENRWGITSGDLDLKALGAKFPRVLMPALSETANRRLSCSDRLTDLGTKLVSSCLSAHGRSRVGAKNGDWKL